MPEAKFQIKRKCEVCGNTFIAKTLDSHYCCRLCTDIAYKKRKAAKAKEEQLNQIAQLIPGEREFISVKEAVAMYAISRDLCEVCFDEPIHVTNRQQNVLPVVVFFNVGSKHYS